VTNRAVASFDVTGWEEKPYHDPEGGPRLSRTVVAKKFTGDLVAESTAELLMCQASAADVKAGAGYVANERVEGSLNGRVGSFVLQHGGLMRGGSPEKTFGHIVPGSGTGDLKGVIGDVEVAVDSDGRHTMTLTYEIEE
jgi:hypothetical protein